MIVGSWIGVLCVIRNKPLQKKGLKSFEGFGDVQNAIRTFISTENTNQRRKAMIRLTFQVKLDKLRFGAFELLVNMFLDHR